MEWSREKLLELIELYRENECLWNPNDGSYKLKSCKAHAWAKISDHLECSVVEAQKKMESLLASFRRERQKCNVASFSQPEVDGYKSSWFAFESMRFLMSKYRGRDARKSENGAFRNDDVKLEQKFPATEADRGLRKRTKSTRRKTNGLEERETAAESSAKKEKRDQSAVFGEYVATKHRFYDTRTRHIVEHLINGILFEADMGKYDESETPTVSLTSPVPVLVSSQSPRYPSSQCSARSPSGSVIPEDAVCYY